MTDFSVLLKQYCSNSGFTIYQLSQTSGVNRTTIQKAVTSRRIPQKDAFHMILSALNLTRAERQKLTDAYEIATDGEYKFRQRRYIKYFLKWTSFSAAQNPSSMLQPEIISVSALCSDSNKMITGRLAIEDTLKLLLCNELQNCKTPSISIFLPMEQEFFQGFFSMLNRCKDIHITQLLYLIKNPAAFENIEFHNLKVLSHILPILLTTAADYHVYYAYNDFAPVPETTTGFPYYILFSDFALLLSPDLDNAWMESNPQLIAFLQKRIQSLTEQSHEFGVQVKDPVGYIEKSISIYADTCFNYSLEYQPCLLPFMSTELIEALMNPALPGKEQIKELTAKNAIKFHSLEKNIILFAEKGLAEFVQNGIIINIPTEYARACEPSERAFLLHQIEAACESGKITIRCINPSNLSIEKQLYLSLQKNKEVSFFSYNVEKNEFRFTGICENTIYAAFSDFIEYMLNSDSVFTKEETVEIIKKYLRLLDNMGHP